MTLRYLLDTKICAYIARRKPKDVWDRFRALEPGSVGMSVITYGTLCYRTEKSVKRDATTTKLAELVTLVPVLPLPPGAPPCYAQIRYRLALARIPVNENDLWVAAHAMADDLTLVTGRPFDFARILGLRIENWVPQPAQL